MLIGYNILNKKEKSGMKNTKLRVFSLKTKLKFWVISQFPVDWDQEVVVLRLLRFGFI